MDPKSEVLARAVELASCTASLNPGIVSLGRDLYYNTRCANPANPSSTALICSARYFE